MQVIPVGTGAASGNPGEAQTCFLVRSGGRALVIDLGSGTLSRLGGLIDPHRVDHFLITHAHPDHCVDLLALNVHMSFGPGRGQRARVTGPPGLRQRCAAFAGSERWGADIDFSEWASDGGACDLGDGLIVRHREVPHVPPTNAVRIEHRGRSVCFSADCAPNDALPELADGADLLICECTFGEGPTIEGVPHLTAADAGRIARRARVGRLLLTHCEPGRDRSAARAAAADVFGGPVDWARPAQEVRL